MGGTFTREGDENAEGGKEASGLGGVSDPNSSENISNGSRGIYLVPRGVEGAGSLVLFFNFDFEEEKGKEDEKKGSSTLEAGKEIEVFRGSASVSFPNTSENISYGSRGTYFTPPGTEEEGDRGVLLPEVEDGERGGAAEVFTFDFEEESGRVASSSDRTYTTPELLVWGEDEGRRSPFDGLEKEGRELEGEEGGASNLGDLGNLEEEEEEGGTSDFDFLV